MEQVLSETKTPKTLEESHQPTAIADLDLAFRIRLFVSGVVFPAMCIITAYLGVDATLNSPWQSGQTHVYVGLLLGWPTIMAMLPLICFSALSMTAFVIRPSLSRRWYVCVGLVTGAILSVQYLVMVMWVTVIVSPIVAAFVGPILYACSWTVHQFAPRLRTFTIREVMILTTVVAIGCAVLAAMKASFVIVESFLIGSFFIVMAAPTLNVIAYGRASAFIVRHNHYRPVLPRAAALVVWLVAWGVSWRWSIAMMMDEYSKLPATNPNCYVSAAAANGHRRFVKSQSRACGPVNSQMCRLKCMEFAFKAATPRLHQFVRWFYNRVGPKLASVCSSSIWFADLTYVMLKPVEWVAVAIAWIARLERRQVDRVYR